MAKHRCKNPYCRRKLESESDMQIGHKKAYSKGGETTLKNSVCLCYGCNRKQGTDSWEKFLKKQSIARGQAEPKASKPKKSKPKRKVVASTNQGLFGSFKSPSWKDLTKGMPD
jgi:5-methylcytosine-specific restriction endonuclease McrA